jgi:hypothetical protein
MVLSQNFFPPGLLFGLDTYFTSTKMFGARTFGKVAVSQQGLYEFVYQGYSQEKNDNLLSNASKLEHTLYNNAGDARMYCCTVYEKQKPRPRGGCVSPPMPTPGPFPDVCGRAAGPPGGFGMRPGGFGVRPRGHPQASGKGPGVGRRWGGTSRHRQRAPGVGCGMDAWSAGIGKGPQGRVAALMPADAHQCCHPPLGPFPDARGRASHTTGPFPMPADARPASAQPRGPFINAATRPRGPFPIPADLRPCRRPPPGPFLPMPPNPGALSPMPAATRPPPPPAGPFPDAVFPPPLPPGPVPDACGRAFPPPLPPPPPPGPFPDARGRP